MRAQLKDERLQELIRHIDTAPDREKVRYDSHDMPALFSPPCLLSTQQRAWM